MWYCYPLLPQSRTLCSFVTKISLNQRSGIKVKFVLSQIKNTYRRSVGRAPLILNLVTRRRWVWVEHNPWESDSHLGGQETYCFFFRNEKFNCGVHLNRSLDPLICHWEQNYILTSSVFLCELSILMLPSDIGLCPTSDLFRISLKKFCMRFSFSPLCPWYFPHPDRSDNCVSNYKFLHSRIKR